MELTPKEYERRINAALLELREASDHLTGSPLPAVARVHVTRATKYLMGEEPPKLPKHE